jgi:hypothetical protein
MKENSHVVVNPSIVRIFLDGTFVMILDEVHLHPTMREWMVIVQKESFSIVVHTVTYQVSIRHTQQQ